MTVLAVITVVYHAMCIAYTYGVGGTACLFEFLSIAIDVRIKYN